MLWQTILLVLLSPSVWAGSLEAVEGRSWRGDEPLERQIEDVAIRSIEGRGYVEVRQNATSANLPTGVVVGQGVQLLPDGTINMTAWEVTVDAACRAALGVFPQATNPTGTCVCYNLPILNNATGAFQAELRLYRKSAATGNFAGIAASQIQVQVGYRGASVSAVSANSSISAKMITARQTTTTTTPLTLLQRYMFVGQMDRAKMTTPVSVQNLEELVDPIVTLSALDSQGLAVSTNVSANEASFVTGVFADQVFMSNATMAQLNVNDIVAGLHNGTVAFVLPGVQILIFPIGLVITGTWAVLGLAVYAMGTLDRIGYAEQYRKNQQRVQKSGVARF